MCVVEAHPIEKENDQPSGSKCRHLTMPWTAERVGLMHVLQLLLEWERAIPPPLSSTAAMSHGRGGGALSDRRNSCNSCNSRKRVAAVKQPACVYDRVAGRYRRRSLELLSRAYRLPSRRAFSPGIRRLPLRIILDAGLAHVTQVTATERIYQKEQRALVSERPYGTEALRR